MKKEKWILGEIESWQSEELITEETAEILKARYEPKKKMNLLIILFSVIGALFVGMGIILIGAQNLWYKLPIPIRTFIGFLPLIVSQGVLIYIYLKKRESIALRECAAILNMAGVFASIAIVGQIFHLPGDFTNYVFVCGVLSLPSMLILNAISPLAIYFWTVLNGGLYLIGEWAMPITILLYLVGVVFVVRSFKQNNGKAIYVACISAVAGFMLLFIASLMHGHEVTVSYLAYFALLMIASLVWDRVGKVLEYLGIAGTLILLMVASYKSYWSYFSDFNIMMLVISILLVVLSIAVMIKKRKFHPFAVGAFLVLIMRIVWNCAELDGDVFRVIFMIATNVVLFAVGVYYIVAGTRHFDLVCANIGMVTVCAMMILRFFDSGLSLGIRGIVFVLVGIGFLVFNAYMIKMKKRSKEVEK